MHFVAMIRKLSIFCCFILENSYVLVENWKLTFLSDNEDRTVITSGEMGKVLSYHVDSAENTTTVESSDIFSTCIASVIKFYFFIFLKKSKNGNFVAIGNTSGGAYLFEPKKKWNTYKMDCHKKMIRSICFT